MVWQTAGWSTRPTNPCTAQAAAGSTTVLYTIPHHTSPQYIHCNRPPATTHVRFTNEPAGLDNITLCVSANHNMVLLGRNLVRTIITRCVSAYHNKVRLSWADQRVRTIIMRRVSAYHKLIRRRGQHNQVRTIITPPSVSAYRLMVRLRARCQRVWTINTPRVCAYHNMARLSSSHPGPVSLDGAQIILPRVNLSRRSSDHLTKV